MCASALAAPALALAIAACGGSSTGSSARTLKVEATGPQLNDQNATGSPYLVQGVGGGLLYAQNSCPGDLSRYRLFHRGTGRTSTYPCLTSVVAGARGQLLVVDPHGRARLSAPGRSTRRVELPAHTVRTAVAPDDSVFYVKNLAGGRVCIGRVAPGQRSAGSCPPLTLPDGDLPGPFVVSTTGVPVLISVPPEDIPGLDVLRPVTLTGGRYVIARNEVRDDRGCAPVDDLSVAAAGDGSVWMTCNYFPPYPIRLSPDGRTLNGVPGVRGFTGLVGAAADAHGNVWTIATLKHDITASPDPPILLRYRAGGGRPTIFVVDPTSPGPEADGVAGDPEHGLWIADGSLVARLSLPGR